MLNKVISENIKEEMSKIKTPHNSEIWDNISKSCFENNPNNIKTKPNNTQKTKSNNKLVYIVAILLIFSFLNTIGILKKSVNSDNKKINSTQTFSNSKNKTLLYVDNLNNIKDFNFKAPKSISSEYKFLKCICTQIGKDTVSAEAIYVKQINSEKSILSVMQTYLNDNPFINTEYDNSYNFEENGIKYNVLRIGKHDIKIVWTSNNIYNMVCGKNIEEDELIKIATSVY